MKNSTLYKKVVNTLAVLLVIFSVVCFATLVIYDHTISLEPSLVNKISDFIFSYSLIITYVIFPVNVVLLLGTFIFNLRRFGEFVGYYLIGILGVGSYLGMWVYILYELGKSLENF
jgi:hypothetical protein